MKAVFGSRLDPMLAECGLLVLGAFKVGADEFPGHAAGSTLVLAGNAGSDMWAHFSASREFGDNHPDPLNRWSRRVGQAIADELGADVIFPFEGPPYAPFLRWAQRTGQVSRSPISMSIHHQYGLWHAYRFALVVPDLPNRESPDQPNPCITCSGQPCLRACPADAFKDGVFAADPCVAQLVAAPAADCNTRGCLARSSCPVNPKLHYLPVHAQFHMRAFRHSQNSGN
jgi:hypothetical protein